MLDNLAGLAVFAKVVEHEGFSRAADVLGMSKSAVSKQVSGLEDRLGMRLLNRTTRQLSLTESGARLYERCQRILSEVEEAEREAGRLQSRPTGVLRVTAGMSFGHLHLAPLMAEFLARFPDLNVELVLNDRVVDLVEEGYDVGLRIGDLDDSALMARKLSPIERLTVAAPEYLASHGTPERPADLAGHTCLAYSYGRNGNSWRFTAPGSEARIRFAPRLMVNNGDTLRGIAESGAAIVQLPSFLVGASVRDGRLVEILRPFRPAASGLYAVYPHNRHVSVKVRAFIDFIARQYGPAPYWDAGLDADGPAGNGPIGAAPASP